MSQRAKTTLRVNEKLAKIRKGPDLKFNQARYQLNQFNQAFIIFKSARAQIEEELAKSRISKAEKTRKMVKIRAQMMAAIKRFSQFQTIDVKSTMEMQAVADLQK